ncbi:MAG: hypothetical protein HKN59_02170 [Gammaproteobacteria bacterium]|nr:hypothetical protein [Gammaproteobacteria bacterium]
MQVSNRLPLWAAAIFLTLTLAGCDEQRSLEPEAGQEAGEAGTDESDAGAAIAASVPDTEIFLADLAWQDSQPTISGLRNITQRVGYDNQPKFMPDGKSLVFSSIRDGKQSDVYRYLIADGQIVPYTQTSESEYSPTPIPGGEGISVVRVEADGTQRLWRFPAANANPVVLFSDVSGVGYHAWLSDSQAAMFIVADPAFLMIADQSDGARRKIAAGIGRSLARIPGDDALAFVNKDDEIAGQVIRYDLGDGSFAELISTPAGSEDFAWSRNGGLFMAEASSLNYWDGHADSQWQEVAGLPDEFAGRITRIDVSNEMDRLAFVAEVQ